jgi:transcriptional regulator GlxA family with amidase domain
MAQIQSICFVAFPNAGEQDLLVPYELLRSVAWDLSRQGQKLEVVLGCFGDLLVPTQMGTAVRADRTLRSHDRFDLVYVPGGLGAGAQSSNEVLLSFLRAHQEEGHWVGANCAGMGVLHRAGVLRGMEVTTPATLWRRLPEQGTQVVNPRRAWRIIPEKKVFSSGGAGTVHPSTIALVWHLFGDRIGRELAAGWDSSPLFGEALFALDGPVMQDDETVRTRLQETWEEVFLPTPAAV